MNESTFKINPKFRLTTRHLSVAWHMADKETLQCDDPALVESAMEHFDSVWRGEHSPHCGRRQYGSDPIK